PQSLIAITQSSAFRTNFGLVNDNVPSTVALTAFSGAGEKLFETTMSLAASEQRQLGPIFAAQGISTDDARLELRVLTSGARVYSYASMVDNATGDPSFVMPSTATTTATRLTVPGIGDLAAADGRWQSDVRLYNGGDAAAEVSLAFYKQGESEPADVQNVTLAPGQVRAFDGILQSLYEMTGTSGSLRIVSSSPSVAAAARTYQQRSTGTLGQFVPASDEQEAIGAGDGTREILQVEESPFFRTNVGLVEVSGKPATVTVTVSAPGSTVSASTAVDLKANESRQLNSLLRSMGYSNTFNARVSVQVTGGEGRIISYGSVIDNATQDPTFVMAQ
ncbi:MAG: hypothetical protein JWN02_1896, partial [Acidobacteria bacterium]|nr:hypothetical protein [Acidobacteriota bacterium]